MSRAQKGNDPSRKRIDVTSAPPPLSHSPFAALAEKKGAPSLPNDVSAPAAEPAATPPKVTKPTSRGRLVLRRETAHRGGKTVVVVGGFLALPQCSDAQLSALERQLKQRLGCGGSIDPEKREILIQGDRPAELAALLRELGFEVAGVTTAGKARR